MNSRIVFSNGVLVVKDEDAALTINFHDGTTDRRRELPLEHHGPTLRVRGPEQVAPPAGPWVTPAVTAASAAVNDALRVAHHAAAQDAADTAAVRTATTHLALMRAQAAAGQVTPEELDAAIRDAATARAIKSEHDELRGFESERVAAARAVLDRVTREAQQTWERARFSSQQPAIKKLGAAFAQIVDVLGGLKADADQAAAFGRGTRYGTVLACLGDPARALHALNAMLPNAAKVDPNKLRAVQKPAHTRRAAVTDPVVRTITGPRPHDVSRHTRWPPRPAPPMPFGGPWPDSAA